MGREWNPLSAEQIRAGQEAAARILSRPWRGEEEPESQGIAKALEGLGPSECGGFVPENDAKPASKLSWSIAMLARLRADGRRALLEWGANPWISKSRETGAQWLHPRDMAAKMYPAGKSGPDEAALGKAAWRWVESGPFSAFDLFFAERALLRLALAQMTPGDRVFGAGDRRGLSACENFARLSDEREAALARAGAHPTGEDLLGQAKEMGRKAKAMIAAKGSAIQAPSEPVSPAALARAKTLGALCQHAPEDPEAFAALLAASAGVLSDPRALCMRFGAKPSPLAIAVEGGAAEQAAAMLDAGADPWLAAGEGRKGNPIAWGAGAAWLAGDSPKAERFAMSWARACLRGARASWGADGDARALEAAREAAAAMAASGKSPAHLAGAERIRAFMEGMALEADLEARGIVSAPRRKTGI